MSMDGLRLKIVLKLLMLTALMVTSCTPSGGKSRKRVSSLAQVDITPKVSPTSGNGDESKTFSQIGSDQFNGVFTLKSDFNDSFLLRGEIHEFIASGDSQFKTAIQCLVFLFP